jgi:hypothetical protein
MKKRDILVKNGKKKIMRLELYMMIGFYVTYCTSAEENG